MLKNLNRRRISYFNFTNFILIFFIVLTLLIFFILYLNKDNLIRIFYSNIQNISYKYDYLFVNTEISGLDKIEDNNIKSIVNEYLNTSIFLLPLGKITKRLKENNWVKNIKLSTNYSDTLFIDIDEYKPIGLYRFNKKLFYFDTNGKIIDVYDNQKNLKLIIFSGQSSNLNAQQIIDILNKLNFLDKFNISEINYINKRRWDILIDNDIRLMLSENQTETSIKNFLVIEKNLSEKEKNNILSFDLRNIKKTLITYKND